MSFARRIDHHAVEGSLLHRSVLVIGILRFAQNDKAALRMTKATAKKPHLRLRSGQLSRQEREKWGTRFYIAATLLVRERIIQPVVITRSFFCPNRRVGNVDVAERFCQPNDLLILVTVPRLKVPR